MPAMIEKEVSKVRAVKTLQSVHISTFTSSISVNRRDSATVKRVCFAKLNGCNKYHYKFILTCFIIILFRKKKVC